MNNKYLFGVFFFSGLIITFLGYLAKKYKKYKKSKL